MSVNRFVPPIGTMPSTSTVWPTTSWTTRFPASSSSIWATARSTATAFVNGVGLPDNLKSNYKNNFKDFLISHLNLPFHYVGGNIDLTDYSHNPGLPGHDNDPFVLMRTYINETELNNYPYAMMRNGILFLAVPEMDAEPWTRPATCEWLEFMTTHYHDATTIILSHQAIEDTTPADGAADSYRGQQDQGWWASLFQRNPQIKMFLHGHNHMAGWYQGSQSSGFSRPVQNFGHEMIFASPFPGMSWLVDYNLVDAIVIFTISPRFITAKAWKQDGTRGKWCAGFDQTLGGSDDVRREGRGLVQFSVPHSGRRNPADGHEGAVREYHASVGGHRSRGTLLRSANARRRASTPTRTSSDSTTI